VRDLCRAAVQFSRYMRHFVEIARSTDASGLVRDASGLVREASGLVREASGLVRDILESMDKNKGEEMKDIKDKTEAIAEKVLDLEKRSTFAEDPEDVSNLVRDASGLVRDASGLVRNASGLVR
jgi:hypothetical protein